MKALLSFVATMLACLPMLAADDQPDSDIARGGEGYDQSLENRENRASENGNENRANSLENRQDNAENRQENRQDNR